MADANQDVVQVEEPVETESTKATEEVTTPEVESTTSEPEVEEKSDTLSEEPKLPEEAEEQAKQDVPTASPDSELKDLETIRVERELLQSKNQELVKALEDIEKQKAVMQKRVDDNVAFNKRIKEEMETQNALLSELAEQRDVYKNKTYEALKAFQSGELDYDEYRGKLTQLDLQMEGRISELQDKLAASKAHNKILEASRIAELTDEDRKDLEKIISEQPSVWFQKAIYNDPEDLALLINRVVAPIREQRKAAVESQSPEISSLKKEIEELKNLIMQQSSQKQQQPKVDKPVLKKSGSSTATETPKTTTKSDYPLLFKR